MYLFMNLNSEIISNEVTEVDFLTNLNARIGDLTTYYLSTK